MYSMTEIEMHLNALFEDYLSVNNCEGKSQKAFRKIK